MSICSSNITNDISPLLLNKDGNLKALSQKNILLIKAMSDILNEEIEINEIRHRFSKKDLFYSEKILFSSVEEFILILMNYLRIERTTLIISYISMKKFLRKSKNNLTLNILLIKAMSDILNEEIEINEIRHVILMQNIMKIKYMINQDILEFVN